MSQDDFKQVSAPLGDVMRALHEQLAERGTLPDRQPKPAANCSRCGGRGYLLGREGPLATAAACGCETACTRCGGKGFQLQLKDGYQFQLPCECRTLPQRIAAYNACHLPARFSGKSLADFYTDDSRELLVARREMMHFAETARPGHTRLGKGLLGKPGRGKTHLLVATLAQMTLGRGVSCRYIEISFLFADLKAAISDPKARATVDKIDELAEIDVLAIDELGKGRGSVFEEEVLDELIGRRYNNGKLTLFATNYPREEPPPRRDGGNPEPFAQSLRARVGERVFSRLHEMVEFLELPEAVPDRRIPPR